MNTQLIYAHFLQFPPVLEKLSSREWHVGYPCKNSSMQMG
jgi:hypothetical protein